MGQIKTYTILTETLNGGVKAARLHKEIEDSNNLIGFRGVTVSDGEILISYDSIIDENILNNIINNHDDVEEVLVDFSLFGSEYNYIESEKESSTTSKEYLDKLILELKELPTGDYLIEWYCETHNDDKKGSIGIQITLNKNSIGSSIIEPNDDENWISQSGFKNVNISGVNTIKIQYLRNGKGLAKIRNARLKINRTK